MNNENPPEPPVPTAPPAEVAPSAAAPVEAPVPAETAIMLPRGPGGSVTDAAQSVPQPPLDDDDVAWLANVDWILLSLLVALGFLLASTPAFNSDVWLHLGTGRLIAQGEYLPGGADPFSCATEATDTEPAVPWINHSWLYALGLYLVYSLVGGMGTVIAKALFVAGLVVVLMQIRAKNTNLLLVACCLLLGVLALGMRLFLQPVLVSYLFLALTLLILQRAGAFAVSAEPEPASGAERWLWALPVLCLVWVNLDNWFILGPLVVALTAAGVALQRWRGTALPVRAGQLALVCGACLVACVVNPFHVRAFQLPSELSYLLVSAGERVGVALPDALVAGGRTLAALEEDNLKLAPTGQRLPFTLSPFSSDYLNNPALGNTIGGWCFMPLLGLGLLSFIAAGFLANRPGGPTMQPARFLVWVLFAALAVLLYRLIPFFVIAAVPLTALNLSDLLDWYTQPTEQGVSDTPWVAPVRLARLLGVPLLLALLALAWPGWLTGRFDLGSRNHVAWDIPADVSMRAAAERLAAVQQSKPAGTHVHMFNLGHTPLSAAALDLPCYCAWFAPGVKGFIDPRFSLYSNTIRPFLAARVALFDKKKSPREWSDLFERYRIDHVAVENFQAFPQAAYVWWSEPRRWEQQFADRNAAVFAWSGPQPHWRADAVLTDWNRQAFGAVPLAARPPSKGVTEAPQNRDLWLRYLDPPPRLPQSAYDMDVKLLYGEFSNTRALQFAALTIPALSTLQNDAALQIAPMYSLGAAPWYPGAFVGPAPVIAAVLAAQDAKMQGKLIWAPPDTIEPAIPILLTRSGWHTVVAAPENERSYVYLAQAVLRNQRQEDFWVNPGGPAPRTLRAALRRTQLLAALWTATEIGFAEPLQQYQMHRDLANQYLEQKSIDLAADHLKLAEEAWDAIPLDDPRAQEEWRKEKKRLAETVKGITQEVERRKNAFKLQFDGKPPMEKVLQSLFPTYRPMTKGAPQNAMPWELTGMTLEMLNNMKFDKLSEAEQGQWLGITIELLFKIGRARDAAELFERSKNRLEPTLRLQYGIFRAGTQGNYAELRELLEERDKALLEQESVFRRFQLASTVSMLAPNFGPCEAISRGGAMMKWTNDISRWAQMFNELCSNRTLFGIIDLEAGDTAQAKVHFDAALRDSTRLYYLERPIAARYAEMLRRYQAP